MNLFLVTLSGDGFRLVLEDKPPVEAGFVKNMFVIATDSERARQRAIEDVRKKIDEQAYGGGIVLGDININVDNVSSSLMFWKIINPEGFVFFPIDNA